jgi:HTH-type transcriptional regulator/antitoxin HipB
MRVRNAKDLGLLLRQTRKDHGWTQQELADRIGASRHWVIGVERGKPKAETGLVLQALAALDLTVDVRSHGPGGLPRDQRGAVPRVTDLKDVLLGATGGAGRRPPPSAP